ncbi:MAG TPA: hypothetical protein VFM06_05590 [Candidatus Limnocylindria bacterium]|nr:hypothetical protein [Candidatus Limnocylindria bacterium]
MGGTRHEDHVRSGLVLHGFEPGAHHPRASGAHTGDEPPKNVHRRSSEQRPCQPRLGTPNAYGLGMCKCSACISKRLFLRIMAIVTL